VQAMRNIHLAISIMFGSLARCSAAETGACTAGGLWRRRGGLSIRRCARRAVLPVQGAMSRWLCRSNQIANFVAVLHIFAHLKLSHKLRCIHDGSLGICHGLYCFRKIGLKKEKG